MSTDLSLRLRRSGRDLGQRSGMSPERAVRWTGRAEILA
jgi:hypothetical protein